MRENIFNILIDTFKKIFSYQGEFIKLRSPGRINLIGEHTDYNNGFVLPATINLEINAVAIKRNDSKIRAYSMDLNELEIFDINEIKKNKDSWINYVKGVIFELGKIKKLKYGADIVYKSNLPIGSGLSSSAAFELINSILFAYINEVEISKENIALLCQRVENNFIGVNCGIMDQFVIALGKKNTALFLDTLTLKYDFVNINLNSYKFIICNTNKPRELISSKYNERRKECEEAIYIFKKINDRINSLRDVSFSFLEKNKKFLPNNIYKRVFHVITENERVLKAKNFLSKEELEKFGKLLFESHNSLKNFYQVSCFELDLLVEEAEKIEGVLGSRMIGAGFGGCTLTLIKNESVNEFLEKVNIVYQKKTGREPSFYIVEIVNGAEIVL